MISSLEWVSVSDQCYFPSFLIGSLAFEFTVRNTYTLLDYGDFVDDSTNDRGEPFVQLLPITNVNEAHQDFVQVRLSGVDTTGDSSQWLLPASEGQTSPETEAEKKQHLEGAVLRQWPYILLGCLLFVILVVGLIIWKCCCRRKKNLKKADNSVNVLPLSHMKRQSMYRPLDNDPPPYKRNYPNSPSVQNLTYTQ